jgi:hypothetical protein
MFIGATATALVLSCDLSPSALAQSGVASHQKADTLAPRRTRRSNPLVPFEAFGALAGAITSIAAAEHERETYGPYYSPSYAPHVVGRLRQTPPLITRPVSGTP